MALPADADKIALENSLRTLERGEQFFRSGRIAAKRLLPADEIALAINDALSVGHVPFGLFVPFDPGAHRRDGALVQARSRFQREPAQNQKDHRRIKGMEGSGAGWIADRNRLGPKKRNCLAASGADSAPAQRCMTRPATAPMNSKRQAVDWMKKPGNRFSTALL